MLGVVVAIFLFTTIRTDSPERASLTFSQFTSAVSDGTVKSVSYDPSNGNITGDFKTPQDGKSAFSSDGPNDDLQPSVLNSLKDNKVDVEGVKGRFGPRLTIDTKTERFTGNKADQANPMLTREYRKGFELKEVV